MQQIEKGIFFDNSFLGVTVGGLVYSFGIILVDAPLRLEDTRAWRSALVNQRGGSNRILINLDAHPDRTLGARSQDCPIVAHQKAAQVFRNRPTIFKGQSTASGSAWELYSESIGMRWAPPDITFTNRMNFHWGGPEVVLEHHPGPSAGSCWVIIPDEKVVFVGDSIAVNQPPFLANADLEAWVNSLELLVDAYRDCAIVAGRGGIASKKVIQAQISYLKNVSHGIDRLVKRNSGPEATRDLIPELLREFDIDDADRDIYTQRLHYGLYQYYARHYRPTSSLEQPGSEEDDE